MKQKQLPYNEKQKLIKNFGDWAVITGASSGIGLELATRLAEAGFHLLINSRHENDLQRVQADLQSRYQVQVKTIEADVGTREGVQNIIGASANHQIGLFVAAAGFGTSGAFIRNNIETEMSLLQVNCEGVLRLTHYFSQQFAKQRRGGIILLSSMVAFQGVPYAANYAASKAYIQSFAEALGIELKRYNVDVLAAAPGPVESGFGKRANMKMGTALKPGEIGISILKALGKRPTVLPGLLTKVLVYSLRALPRWGKVRVMGKVMEGFTKHHRSPLMEYVKPLP